MRNLWMVLLLLGLAAGAAEAKRKKRPNKAGAPTVSLACSADSDCAVTRFADGECCPMLCQPRVVAKASAEVLAKFGAGCKTKCAMPACAPPQRLLLPACVAGKCVLKASALGD
jgi:hypothetical protein